MNSIDEQTIREKIKAHEQQVDVDVDTDALWGRLVASSSPPAKNVVGLKYKIAVAAALLVAGIAFTTLQLFKEDGSKVVVTNEVVAQNQSDNYIAAQTVDAGQQRVADDRLQSDKQAIPKHRKSAKEAYFDNVTEYLKSMDIPAMMGMYAGKEDFMN